MIWCWGGWWTISDQGKYVRIRRHITYLIDERTYLLLRTWLTSGGLHQKEFTSRYGKILKKYKVSETQTGFFSSTRAWVWSCWPGTTVLNWLQPARLWAWVLPYATMRPQSCPTSAWVNARPNDVRREMRTGWATSPSWSKHPPSTSLTSGAWTSRKLINTIIPSCLVLSLIYTGHMLLAAAWLLIMCHIRLLTGRNIQMIFFERRPLSRQGRPTGIRITGSASSAPGAGVC